LYFTSTFAYEDLKKLGLHHFDSWASTFGETTAAMELSPEGNGYRIKTRFSKFYNLPELMTQVKQFADIHWFLFCIAVKGKSGNS